MKSAFLLLSSLLTLSCSAQVLTPSEHHALMNRLQSATFDWQRRIESLDIDKLNVEYSTGKTLEQEKALVLKNIAFIQRATEQQLIHDQLSTDISLEGSVKDVMSFASEMLALLPNNAEALRWGRAVPQPNEFDPFLGSLEQHVLSYADQLQTQASKCSR